MSRVLLCLADLFTHDFFCVAPRQESCQCVAIKVAGEPLVYQPFPDQQAQTLEDDQVPTEPCPMAGPSAL